MKDSHLECCWGKKLNFEPLVNWTRCGGKGAEEPLSLRPEIVACTKLIWLWWKTTLVSASRPLAGHEHWPSLPIFKILLEAFWHIFHWSHIIFFSGSNSQTLSMLNCKLFFEPLPWGLKAKLSDCWFDKSLKIFPWEYFLQGSEQKVCLF